MHCRLHRTAIQLLISLALIGCASTKDTVLPHQGPTMKAIYEAHFETLGAEHVLVLRRELAGRALSEGALDLEGYSRTAHNELNTRFPRLPNPTLVMYIYPHLAGTERVPVPGYATTFPLYERVEYALPGEVPSGQKSQ